MLDKTSARRLSVLAATELLLFINSPVVALNLLLMIGFQLEIRETLDVSKVASDITGGQTSRRFRRAYRVVERDGARGQADRFAEVDRDGALAAGSAARFFLLTIWVGVS